MKIDIKDLEKSRKEIRVKICSEEMEKYVNRAIDDFSKNSEFNGFRKGKAPKDIIRRRIGDDKILERANNIALEESYLKAVGESGLETIGQPQIEIVKTAYGNPFEYKATVSVFPKIDMWDYTKVSGEMRLKEIGDEKVEEEIKILQKRKAAYITREDKAQKGDRVEIDFSSRVGKVKIEFGESKNHPLIIGEGHFVDGFEDQLIGMKKGDVKEFSIVFPDDYYKKELAGRNVEFRVEMKLVQKVDLPEINDEFARDSLGFENLGDLKENIKKSLEQKEKARAEEKFRNELADQIRERTEIELPDLLVELELDNMVKRFKASVTQMGIEFDRYLENVGTTVEAIRREWRQAAEKETKNQLIIREISIREGIKVTRDEIEKRADKILKFYSNKGIEKKSAEFEKLEDYVAGEIVREKVFNLLENIAKKNAGK